MATTLVFDQSKSIKSTRACLQVLSLCLSVTRGFGRGGKKAPRNARRGMPRKHGIWLKGTLVIRLLSITMHYAVLVVLVLLAAGAPADGLRIEDYARSQVLSPVMSIYWNVDTANNNITIAVEAQTTGTALQRDLDNPNLLVQPGWIGFGLSANGGMYGADVFVYSFVGSQWTLQDRFASGFFLPLMVRFSLHLAARCCLRIFIGL